ncbi:MAG: hypothetical protein RL607_1804 [Bacteroidota bacterium]|jgi:hypothetical protein
MSSIIDKSYKRLSIQVSLSGLSFAVFDVITDQVVLLHFIPFNSFQRSSKIEDLFAVVFHDHPELRNHYDEIKIIHSNNLCTFVPTALFDEEFIGSYLQYNTKVFETDFFAHDSLTTYDIENVYIPYVNMNNFFIDQYGSFDYQHAHTLLVQKLLDYSKNSDQRKMYVHVSSGHFEIIVIEQRKLQFYNSFEFKTPEDFIYYILFTAEQLQLNPESFELDLLGNISEDDPLYTMVYTYVRHVSLMPLRFMANGRSEAENRHHFILVHA